MCANGSTRAPNREVVRRTPLATARTLPCRWVSSVMMRSASPSFCTRSTTPVSRYRLTQSSSHRWPSETETAQLLGIALPVFGDLHVQVEVDRGTQQSFDVRPRAAAD